MANTLLVTGATGTIGCDLAKRGAAVRPGVRDPDKAKGVLGSDITLTPFDFEDPQSFRNSLKDVTKVFILPPLMPNQVETINACSIRISIRIRTV